MFAAEGLHAGWYWVCRVKSVGGHFCNAHLLENSVGWTHDELLICLYNPMKDSASVSKEYNYLTLVVPLNQPKQQSPALYAENGWVTSSPLTRRSPHFSPGPVAASIFVRRGRSRASGPEIALLVPTGQAIITVPPVEYR